MYLDPKHLLVLAEIYDAGGFTEAALSLATSQPSLSRIVKSLEDRIGETLLSRTRKPLQLTPIGRRLVDQGRAIRTATRRASESVDRVRSGEEGELRIGGTPFFLDGFFSSLIAEFQAMHASVTIEFSHGYTDELISHLIAGRLDVAVCPVDSLNPEKGPNPLSPETGLEYTPLIKGHNVIACRVGHPLRSKTDLSPKDLLDYPWVAPPPRSPLNADLRNALSWADAGYIKVVASGGGLGSVVNYIAHTDCLTILPHTVVFALHRHGSLSALPLELNHPNRTLGLLTPQTSATIPVIEKLTKHLKSRLAEMLEQIRQHESAVMRAK